jgi:hypothetical protein
MSPNAGGGVSANEYRCAHEAQINFGDLSPYLTYDSDPIRIVIRSTVKSSGLYTLAQTSFSHLAVRARKRAKRMRAVRPGFGEMNDKEEASSD